MTTLTFLESDRPLTKKYTKKPDGSIDKQSFLNAYQVTSHQAQITSLADFYVQLRNHADAGHCLLKGNVNRPLVQESRAGSTDALAASDWVCLDFDGLPPTFSIDEVLQLMGIRDVSYVLQWSSSQMILDDSLRCHVFFLLDRPTPAPVLKQWLVQLNHQTTFLRENMKLTKTGMGISWPLDITACQNDKLIYITPPQLEGIRNPLGRRPRYEHVKRSSERLALPTKLNTPETNKLLTIARVNDLRIAANLPSRKLAAKMHGDVEILPKPDEAMITGHKVDRDFVYFNFNGGDSWAYYHPVNNADVIYNFKGEPNYLTKELLPDYYKQAKAVAKHAGQIESSVGLYAPADQQRVLLAFRDRKSGIYYHGDYTPQTDNLDVVVARSEKQVRDFCMQENMPIGDFIPIWDMNFEPQGEYRVDIERRKINTFVLSSYMREAKPQKKPAIPKTINKVLRHMLAGDEPTIEHFINWLAFIVQFRERPSTAWVLYGTEGTGKGTFCSKVLRPILGLGQTTMRPGAQLSSEFNNFLKNNIMVIFDEAHITEMRDSEEIHGKLRNWITEPTVSLREMRANPVEIDNHTSFILLSNQPDVIHLQKKDRRWNIAPFQDKKIELIDEEVRDLIPEELQDFANFLMSWPVNREKARTPLVTEDRDRLISTTTSSADDVAHALSKDNAQMGFFLDQLPTDKKIRPLVVQQKIDDYHKTLGDIVLRTIHRGDGKCNISRDELYDIFEYTVGKMPATPNKFTKFLAHRHIHTEKVRIDKPVYGIQVSFKDFSLFPEYLKEHWPATAATVK